MKIAEFSVKNYQFTIVVFLMVMLLGINALFNIPKAEDPDLHAPQFTVVTVYPGTSPADMEKLVVNPIEEKLNKLDDVKKIISDVNDGLAVTQIYFTYSSNVETKYQDVVREINALRPSLPPDLYSIEAKKITPSDVNIVQLALLSETMPYAKLRKQAEVLKDRLLKIKALKNVEIWACPDPQVRVSLNQEKMARYSVGSTDVIRAIQSENTNLPGGALELGPKKYNVKTSGDYKSIAEVRGTIVHSAAGQVVRVADLAEVSMNYEDETYLGRLNGRRAIFVTASQKEGKNILATAELLKPVIADFNKQLPGGITLEQSFDQGKSVGHRISGFSRDFMIAIGLVLLTLLPLGFRASFVVMISIPLSLAIGLALLYLLGYTINQLSIVGLVVALGLLVDDSIVVVENIERFLRKGSNRRDAAVGATQQISLAVLGTTAVLIFAFLPLANLPEAAGDFIRPLPMAVITTVLASLFVSLTIVPFLSSRILKESHSAEGNFFLRGLKRIIHVTYKPLLDRALKYPIITLLIALGIFVGSLALIPRVGFSVFPKSDKPQFLVTVEAPLGTGLYETNRITRFAESVLKRHPEIVNYASNIGKGNPRIYYNVVQHNEAENYAELFVQIKPISLKETEVLIGELQQELGVYPGAKIQVKKFDQGPPIDAPIAIRLFGDNLDSLRQISFRIEKLIAETPGTYYVNNPLSTLSTDMKVEINREKAGLLGIATADVDRTVRLGLAGLNVGIYKDPDSGPADDDNYNINVSLPRSRRPHLEAFDRLYLRAANGALVPLKEVAKLKLQASPTTIRHFDRDRFTIVTAEVKTGYLTSNVTAELLKKLDKFPFPAGYHYVAAGDVESSNDSFGGLGTIIIITVFGILAVLILEFRTFKSTVIVLSVIPLGIVGAVLILLFTGNSFSFTAIIGLIALVGIEVKNSILLVDFTNQLRASGMPLDQAIEEAGEVRFVPIILTTFTAIGGLLPLVIEFSPLYSPLALVIMGGLISSLLLTRIVTPVLYKLLPPQVEGSPEYTATHANTVAPA